jgi:broad specificity phosphatase PhoE
MSESLPNIYLARHGETAWSRTGQHTGRTDLPLTEDGESQSVLLGRRLKGISFARVWTSPLQRAVQSCRLAGFEDAVLDSDLMEWDYGEYEGRRTAEILAERPDWQLFRDGCPGGETPEQVGVRADRIIERARQVPGDVLLFGSGHLLRMLAARWLGMEPESGRFFLLGTASLCLLSFDHNRTEPAIRLWNDRSHLTVE